jgi:hypothetical protein
MRTIRGGSGLGDSLYVRPIAEHLSKQDQVRVLSDYPDVFYGAGERVEVRPFKRDKTDVVAHYTWGKYNEHTTQWQDVCTSARVPQLPLRINWSVRNPSLVKQMRIRAGDRQIVVVHGGRVPMGRKDGFGRELLPSKGAFDYVMGLLDGNRHYIVRVGKEDQQVYPVRADVVMNGAHSVADMFDVASISCGFITQCSFMVPLAEAFDKPLFAVWASKGLESNTKFISAITPRKILSSPLAKYAVDNWPQEKIKEAFDAFRFI